MDYQKEKEFGLEIMVINMKANGKMDQQKEKELGIIKMEKDMKVIL